MDLLSSIELAHWLIEPRTVRTGSRPLISTLPVFLQARKISAILSSFLAQETTVSFMSLPRLSLDLIERGVR
jgi:hypothetical protein